LADSVSQVAKANLGDDQNPAVAQAGFASDHAQQALLGSGVQNIYFDDRGQDVEPAISLAPPFGLRDDNLPMRGRDILLEELSNPDPATRVHLLHGLGGCGKTRLALEVAYRAHQDGTEVWWVPATAESGFLAGMRSLGRRLGVTDAELRHGDAADVIWQHLLARAEPWLLVIDNADEPAILAGAGSSAAEGRGWVRRLPNGSAGRVLITSRDGNAETWGGWCRRHRVWMLTDDQAAMMLGRLFRPSPEPRRRRGREEPCGATRRSPSRAQDRRLVPGSVREHSGGIRRPRHDRHVPRLPSGHRRRRRDTTDQPTHAGPSAQRLWQALAALDDSGLIDLTRPAQPDDIAVLRLHPLVRDTSRRSATERLSLLATAASLVSRATAAPEVGVPEDPPVWPIWRPDT
jgi:hypothetical protein